MRLKFADFGARAIQALSAEKAHAATVKLMSTGLGPHVRADRYARLATQVAGLNFDNPLGLAAGFDKNAEAANALLSLGFGFVEVGAVTPLPQPGNEKPRVFRLREDRAVINRYGFNNDGLDVIARRLARRRRKGVVGINLGANKKSDDRIEDYVKGIARLEGSVDFYTVNISSPNTPGLRTLQDAAALNELLSRVMAAKAALTQSAPIFLKVAPDLVEEDKADIVDAVKTHKLDGLIVSNTTLARPETLRSEHAGEMGGLSGRPLFERSTRLLGEFYQGLGGEIPLIGVGGVGSVEDAYRKIKAGASLVQLYTALVYEGPSLVPKIVSGLDQCLERDGFRSIADAVGADHS